MSWNTPLGRWLAENDVPLRQASEQTGLSISALSLLARGKRRAMPRTMARIARGLGVGVDELFEVSPSDSAVRDERLDIARVMVEAGNAILEEAGVK